MNITIAIADDDLLVSRGLADILADYPQITIGATYADGEELLDGLKNFKPDVLLLDIQMPGKKGDELASIITRTYTDIAILIITNLDQTMHVQNLLMNGALGYLLKSVHPDVLMKAIESVYNGKQFIDPVLKEQLLNDVLDQKRKNNFLPMLSRREKEVLQLIADELTNPEIAKKLFISQRTVETHRENLSLKLGVKNTAGLVKKAVQMGLIE